MHFSMCNNKISCAGSNLHLSIYELHLIVRQLLMAAEIYTFATVKEFLVFNNCILYHTHITQIMRETLL